MKKNKTNNKGFSLVELIIVIAIMAILIGVLAPQYLKFVERSRKSTDRQNVDEIVRAVNIYAADPEASPQIATDATGTTLTLTTGSAMTIDSGINATAITQALQDSGIVPATFANNTVKLKSSKWNSTTITLKFVVDSNGNVTVIPSDYDILGESSSTPAPTSTP